MRRVQIQPNRLTGMFTARFLRNHACAQLGLARPRCVCLVVPGEDMRSPQECVYQRSDPNTWCCACRDVVRAAAEIMQANIEDMRE